jgi:hypothetical protein
VLRDRLGLGAEEIQRLREAGVLGKGRTVKRKEG